MEEIYQQYKDRAQFLLIYIREAHPADGWQLSINEMESIVFDDPTTLEEREEIAGTCIADLGLTMPALIDDMDDTANEAYSGWPDRLFIVGLDGKIAYASGPGPGGFTVGSMLERLKELIGEEG